MAVRIFIHGLESSNQGTKAIFFRKNYPDMIIPNFKGDLHERMERLNEILSGKSGIRLVGSSFGGLMACLFALQNEGSVERMILLAPAINLKEFVHDEVRKISIPVWVYHGTRDLVIPLREVEGVARKTFRNLSFHVVEDDHYLHKTFEKIDWERLLS
ncbi:MAG: YqiA/YcfP family alpha/beta fold hydrolase [Pseudomonadota bacterium]